MRSPLVGTAAGRSESRVQRLAPPYRPWAACTVLVDASLTGEGRRAKPVAARGEGPASSVLTAG